jgi:hypothetical protein
LADSGPAIGGKGTAIGIGAGIGAGMSCAFAAPAANVKPAAIDNPAAKLAIVPRCDFVFCISTTPSSSGDETWRNLIPLDAWIGVSTAALQQ